jgi:hypothetical protein
MDTINGLLFNYYFKVSIIPLGGFILGSPSVSKTIWIFFPAQSALWLTSRAEASPSHKFVDP